jgi:hypothetical protein
MSLRLAAAIGLMILGSGTTVQAQNKYDVFLGQYMASARISMGCDGLGVLSEQSAANIAKSQDRLRKQKVLRLLYYGQSAYLKQLGEKALTTRDVDPKNTSQLCRFGRKVAGTEDVIGRFLRTQK